jgi:hypothetical protein
MIRLLADDRQIFAPKELSRIARRFNAGFRSVTAKVPKGRLKLRFNPAVPSRLDLS